MDGGRYRLVRVLDGDEMNEKDAQIADSTWLDYARTMEGERDEWMKTADDWKRGFIAMTVIAVGFLLTIVGLAERLIEVTR